MTDTERSLLTEQFRSSLSAVVVTNPSVAPHRKPFQHVLLGERQADAAAQVRVRRLRALLEPRLLVALVALGVAALLGRALALRRVRGWLLHRIARGRVGASV